MSQEIQTEITRLTPDLVCYHAEGVVEIVVFSRVQLDSLKALLARGLNTWPEAPPELFELDQLLNFGKLLTPPRTGG
jgi:hypothetical protein